MKLKLKPDYPSYLFILKLIIAVFWIALTFPVFTNRHYWVSVGGMNTQTVLNVFFEFAIHLSFYWVFSFVFDKTIYIYMKKKEEKIESRE